MRLIKNALLYGLKSIWKAPKVQALLVIFILVLLAVTRSRAAGNNWKVAVGIATYLELIILLMGYGFVSLEVRNKNGLENQARDDRTVWAQFGPLSWRAILASIILLVTFIIVTSAVGVIMSFLQGAIAGDRTLSRADQYVSNIPFLLLYPIAFTLYSLLLGPALVGYTSLMLNGREKFTKGLLKGYKLSKKKIWYPFGVLAVVLVPLGLIPSVFYFIEASVFHTPQWLGWAYVAVNATCFPFVFIWIAASFNRVFSDLTAMSDEAIDEQPQQLLVEPLNQKDQSDS